MDEKKLEETMKDIFEKLTDEQKEKANEAIYEYFPDISLDGDGDDYETDTSVYDGEEVYGR